VTGVLILRDGTCKEDQRETNPAGLERCSGDFPD
jgi:hypothetical protein